MRTMDPWGPSGQWLSQKSYGTVCLFYGISGAKVSLMQSKAAAPNCTSNGVARLQANINKCIKRWWHLMSLLRSRNTECYHISTLACTRFNILGEGKGSTQRSPTAQADAVIRKSARDAAGRWQSHSVIKLHLWLESTGRKLQSFRHGSLFGRHVMG